MIDQYFIDVGWSRGVATPPAASVSDLPAAFAMATGAVEPRVWDNQLAQAHFYSSAGWLNFCRQDVQGLTGAVHVGSSQAPLAAVAVTAVTAETNPFYRWADILGSRNLPSPASSGLMLGARRGYQTHLLGQPGSSAEQRARLLLPQVRGLAADLAHGPLTVAGQGSPACIALQLGAGDVQALRASGVRSPAVLTQLDAWIEVPEGGWEGYLDSLESKARITSVRRERRQFEASGLTIVERSLKDTSEIVGRLLAQTENRYGNPVPAELLAAEFATQARLMDAQATVLLCQDEQGHVAGFSLLYHLGDTLYLRAAGFDYERLRGAYEYFNLVYYKPLEIAARLNARWMHAGIEAAEAKAARGAQLRGLWLLDLSEDSLLEGCPSQVAEANRQFLADHATPSKTILRALAPDVQACL